MKKAILVLYILFIHILLVAILIKPELVNTATYKLGIYPAPTHHDKLLARHLRHDSRIQLGDIIFIGDSIMEKADISQITAKGHNLGISADWTGGLLKRIPLYRSLPKASLIVLHIGVNDLSLRRGEVEASFARYQQVLDLFPAGIPVVLNSVLPLGKGKNAINNDNVKIVRFNQLIRQLADKKDNYYYLDLASAMQDSSGNLKSEYHLNDHVHLNSQGYRVFTRLLKDFTAKISQQSS